MNYTYMVRCADGTLYTGWTNDLDRRIAAHNAGKGAKYTFSRRPVTLVYAEMHADKVHAMQREYRIKRLTRTEKEGLAAAYTGTPLPMDDAEAAMPDTTEINE